MRRFWTFGMLIFLSVLLAACGLQTPTATPTPTPTSTPPLFITEVNARDAAIAHVLETTQGLKAPAEWTTINVSGGLLGVNAFRFVGDAWTVDVQGPVVPRPEYSVRVINDVAVLWEGKVLADGSLAAEDVGPFLADDSRPTGILGAIVAAPNEWKDQFVRVVGDYEGWDVLGSAGTAPPTTRSDWVIHDNTGAVYVAAGSGEVLGLDVSPSKKIEGPLVELFAEVRVTDSSQPYLWVLNGFRIGPVDDAWIEYERSGGIAGFQDRLEIYADGRAEVQRNGQQSTLQLTSEQLSALQQAFVSVDFGSLRPTYIPEDTCCDRFFYAVHYRDQESGAVHAVYAIDGTVPEVLQPVLDALNALMVPPA